jgi:hypothetical protein
MESEQPIVAIVGSVRRQVVGEQEQEARLACAELGRELAKAGWRLAVYTSEKDFIEPDVVSGYVASGLASEDSIVCYHPLGSTVDFEEAKDHAEFFKDDIDSSEDWEVSFYQSLEHVNGILLLGGQYSALIAGHIVLSRGRPVLAVAHFGGAAQKIWQHLASKPALIEEDDVQAMARWRRQSAEECVGSLTRQYSRLKDKKSAEESELGTVKMKAAEWDRYQAEEQAGSARTRAAGLFLLMFLVMLVSGLTASLPAWAYTIIAVLGLCSAGGFGSTVRMLTPNSPKANNPVATLLGMAVGILFSLLYAVPQLIGNSPSFLLPSGEIDKTIRAQYVSALIVSFLAGLGFDYAMEQLLRRSKESSEELGKRPR